jgi:hypothetical protein
VAATADTSTRPFSFDLKKKLARIAGIDAHRFIQVKSPFRAEEITQHYDPRETILIFARSDKDREQQPQAGGIKKDGTASYLQPYRRNGLKPMNKHGYMVYLPTVQFGPGMTSATEIRAKWPDMQPAEKVRLVQQLYPDTQQKTQLADVIVKMFDTVMAPSKAQPEVAEAVLINDPDAGHLIQPDGGMGTYSEDTLKQNLARKFASMLEMIKAGEYDRLHGVLAKGEVVDAMISALAEYQRFMARQGRRPMARGREIDMSAMAEDYIDEAGHESP